MKRQSDFLQRFLFEHAPVRGAAVRLSATWKAVLERRDYPSPLRALLGEMMAAAALLSATLKFKGRIILQMRGEGPVTLLVVECSHDLLIRAMAHWNGEIEAGPLKSLLGAGQFTIILDPEGKHTYQGVVELEGDSVGAALERYMTASEQVETRLWLGADSGYAGGLLLQRLPGPEGEDADAWNRAQHLAATVTRKELLALPPQRLIQRLFGQEDVRLFEPAPAFFHCPCSRDKVVEMLKILGREEAHLILEEKGAVEVDCEFCNRHYTLDVADVEAAFDTAPAESRTRH